MRCRQCGTELEPVDKFCPTCGTKVEKTTTERGRRSSFDNINTDINQYKQFETPVRKSSKAPVILMIVLAIILVALVAFVFLRNKPEESNNPDVQQEADVQSDVTDTEQQEEKTTEAVKQEPLSLKKIKASEFDSSAYKVVTVKESEVQGANNISTNKYQSSKEKNYSYEGYKAMDGDPVTSWQFDHAPGTLTVSFEKEKSIRAISFKLGNWREDKGPTFRYDQNCRPKQIQVDLGSDLKPFAINFEDEKKENILEFSRSVPVKDIVFNVNSYYKGKETNDICIAEITFYEE